MSVLFGAEREAYMNGFRAGEQQAERSVSEDDRSSLAAEQKQQALLAHEVVLNKAEALALQRAAKLETLEHARLQIWDKKLRAQERLLAKGQALRTQEGANLKHAASLEHAFANSLNARELALRQQARARLSRLDQDRQLQVSNLSTSSAESELDLGRAPRRQKCDPAWRRVGRSDVEGVRP